MEAEIRRPAKNHVVDDIDAEERPRGDETLRDGHIVWARRRIARRGIVEQDDGSRARRDGFAEDIAGSCGAGIERANGDHANSKKAKFRVEQNGAELLDWS